MPTAPVEAAASQLVSDGFVHLREIYDSAASAWSAARAIVAACAPTDALAAGMPELEEVAAFTVPPIGARRRDFQALHIDFGLPIEARLPVDVARFTALYINQDHPPTRARTRLVPVAALLSQRAWGPRDALVDRLRRYGASRGGSESYVEGILARLIEVADGSSSLPAPDAPGFLCGLEFGSRTQERAHLAERGLQLDAVEREVELQPGELLLLDNLAMAHGRLGIRAPLELHQLCLGYRQLDEARQSIIVHRVLAAWMERCH